MMFAMMFVTRVITVSSCRRHQHYFINIELLYLRPCCVAVVADLVAIPFFSLAPVTCDTASHWCFSSRPFLLLVVFVPVSF